MDRFHSVYSIRRETSRRKKCGPGEEMTRKQLTSRPDHLWPELWTKLGRNAQLKERQKWSHEKPKLDNARKLRGIFHRPRGYGIQGDHQECSQEIGNANGSRYALQDQARTVSMARPVVNPMSSNQNLRVSWKPVNPQDCVWENLYRIIMKTILQEKETIHCNIIIWYTNLFLCLKP